MPHRTAGTSTFAAYLTDHCESDEERATQQSEREQRLSGFPQAVMLEVAFPERDVADRWCWQRFGPPHGECQQTSSEYPFCAVDAPHCHVGTWTQHWFGKTDYNYGLCEWYFASPIDRDTFLGFVPELDWGENYPT